MQPTITSVGALSDHCFSVHLSNGHSVIFTLKGRIREPAFAALIESKAFHKPQTDGKRLYWTEDGPSLDFDEIMDEGYGGGVAKQTITKVDGYKERDGCYEEIVIELGHINLININLQCKRKDPLFAEVLSEQFIPKTDGQRVYWYNGASLTLDDIMSLLKTDNGKNHTN